MIYLTLLTGAMLAILIYVIGKLAGVNSQLRNQIQKSENVEPVYNEAPQWYIYPSLFLGFASLIFAFIAPYFFTGQNEASKFSGTGPIGDTIGGLMNPYIAIAGVIVTGLAFFMQFEANKQQRQFFYTEQIENKKDLQEQITRQNDDQKLQQFESQFYEMIRLHRENVSEMEIEGYDFEETGEAAPMKKFATVTKGRKVFVTMKTELEAILKAERRENPLDAGSFRKCYDMFFSGLDKFALVYGNFDPLQMTLRKAQGAHQFPTRRQIYKNHIRKESINGVHMNFNYKPFSGHASRLGHYFRHLYLTVKSVVYSDVLKTDDEKIKYLKILRAQLSNHEQILLFYNWLGEFGEKWENDEHNFFSKYSMIHNLSYDELLDEPFVKAQVEYLRKKAESLGNPDVFEIDSLYVA